MHLSKKSINENISDYILVIFAQFSLDMVITIMYNASTGNRFGRGLNEEEQNIFLERVVVN